MGYSRLEETNMATKITAFALVLTLAASAQEECKPSARPRRTLGSSSHSQAQERPPRCG